MKILSPLLVCALVACASNPDNMRKRQPGDKAVNAAPVESQPCTASIDMQCPEGQIDQCVKERAASDERFKKADAEAEKNMNNPDDPTAGTGTAMALDEGKLSSMTHKCVPK